MVVATAPAPPSRCDPARGDARPESRGASVSGVALGDASSRGPGEVTAGPGGCCGAGGCEAPGVAAAEERRAGDWQLPPEQGGRHAGGGQREGLGLGMGIAGNLRRKLDPNQRELKGARP